jgi:hypothetical protein
MSETIQGEVVKEELPLEEDLTLFEQDASSEEASENASIIIPVEVFKIIKDAPSGEKILTSCIDLAIFLSQKNDAYGDSALDPVRIFSKANATEQILIRIDDKISRLIRGKEFGDDDTLRDLLGYLLLYFVSKANTVDAPATAEVPPEE